MVNIGILTWISDLTDWAADALARPHVLLDTWNVAN